MKSHFIISYKHQEMTKFVNFSTIKGMTATKKLRKLLVDHQNDHINLEWAAVVENHWFRGYLQNFEYDWLCK